jgi:MFS family permease
VRHARPSALWLLCLAHFMTVLDLTVVNGVLDPIGHDLGASQATLQWVIGAYAIGFGGFLLAGGRTADILGPRRVFAAGSLGFALASAACAAAPGPASLVAARGAQGLSAAFLEPAAFALLALAYPAGEGRIRALAVWGSVGGLGAVSGMLIGGTTSELLDWRAVFLLNVPVGVCGLALATRLLPTTAGRPGLRVDLAGAVLLTAGCSGLALLVGSADGGLSTASYGGATLAAVGLLGFAFHHARSPAPLVPHGFLGRTGVALPAAIGSVQGAVMLGTLLLLTITFVDVMRLGPVVAGVAMLGMRATQAGWARVAGRIVDRIGPRRANLTGLAGMATGCASLVRVGEAPSYVGDVLPGLVVLGLAAPLVFVSSSALVLQCVRANEAGLAAGILGASQWLGGSLGVAAVSALLVAFGDGGTTGIRAGFGLCAAAAATAALLGALATRGRPPACRIAGTTSGRPPVRARTGRAYATAPLP